MNQAEKIAARGEKGTVGAFVEREDRCGVFFQRSAIPLRQI
jgi:hypothetical protein